ncbi:MAG: cardiolipin synthase ClsB [Proteobacteria bacterium]|nr:cardiolipin synthase ClsB [Pseudomonadota bacterium]HQR03871.1 cardiolipin synthase ClsB [Rhodocyclaceae bacterium]
MTTPLVAGNRITLLECGAEYFPALEAAIDSAQQEIHLETYIFADDGTGRRIASALCRAARRGVTVRVLADGFGARTLPATLGPALIADGVQLRIYRPEVATWKPQRNRLRRMHRKLVVVDQRIAFVGGINIVDDLDVPGEKTPRYDYAVAVEGPLVPAIRSAARRLWLWLHWADPGRRDTSPAPLSVPAVCGPVAAALLVRDNLRHRRRIEAAYLKAIATARDEIILANAYFLPGKTLRRALRNAARRGVRVTILLQGRVEYLLLHYAARTLYAGFIAAGVRIVEYHRGFLHAKVAVVDAHWATVGSSNIDPFSLLLAREANVVMENATFAATLRTSLLRHIREGGKEVAASDLARRSRVGLLFSRMAYSLVRVMIALTRYGGSEYRE